MSIKDFTEKVFDKYNSRITDEIFLFIENDRELLHDYLLLIEKNKLKVLNSNIAKKIKAKYGLSNLASKNEMPKSKLVQSHTSFNK